MIDRDIEVLWDLGSCPHGAREKLRHILQQRREAESLMLGPALYCTSTFLRLSAVRIAITYYRCTWVSKDKLYYNECRPSQ